MCVISLVWLVAATTRSKIETTLVTRQIHLLSNACPLGKFHDPDQESLIGSSYRSPRYKAIVPLLTHLTSPQHSPHSPRYVTKTHLNTPFALS